MMKVAYTGWTWVISREPELAKRLIEQSFRELKYIGYDYVENFAFIRDFYAENPQELVDLQKKYDVKLVNLYGHFRLDEEAMVDMGKKQLDFLAAVGGKWYNCQSGRFEDEGPVERPTEPKAIDTLCSISNKLGEYAKSLGLTLCFHPHFGTYVFSQEDIDYYAKNTDPNNVSFCIDTAHTTLAGIDSVDLVKQLGKRVGYMHLKDVDTYALSKAEGRDKMATFRSLGHGNVNFPAVKAALEEVGYDGVLCVELDRPAIGNYPAAEISRIYIKNALGL